MGYMQQTIGLRNYFCRFEEWFGAQLPKLDPKRPIVMGNAPYHTRQTEESKCPTTSWKKAEVQEWLKKKGNQDPRIINLAGNQTDINWNKVDIICMQCCVCMSLRICKKH